MNHKKNVCITINSLSAGGAEKQCLLLADALNNQHNVTVVVLKPNKLYQPRLTFLEDNNIKFIFLSKNLFKRTLQLYSFFKRNKTEFIFSFLPTDTVLSAICGKLAGVPYIFGGIRSSFLPKTKFLTLRTINNYVLDYTISNNFSARSTALNLGFKQNVFVVPNGIEIRKPSSKKSKKNIKIISLGRLVDVKQYDVAIKTISKLKEIIGEGYDIEYSIVGKGVLEGTIRNLIKESNLEKEINLITDATDMYALLDEASIYLCSSSSEGISNALMEAMNCALPIVATDVGDNAKLIIDNKSGFLTPVGDYENLASKLFQLIESELLRKEMGEQGYLHLVENYGYDSFKEKYLKIIADPEHIEIKNGSLIWDPLTSV